MGKKSRVKGASFERIIAKDFSVAYYGDSTILRRTPMSGGWGAKYALGDFAGPEDFPFYTECRNREVWSTADFFNKASILYKWFLETREKAQPFHKMPILIFTRNYEEVYLMLEETDLEMNKNYSLHSNPFVKTLLPEGFVVYIFKLYPWLEKLQLRLNKKVEEPYEKTQEKKDET